MSDSFEGKYITITEEPPNNIRKTKKWVVKSIFDGCPLLGYVGWFSRWRKYAFFPAISTVFEEVCMREISNFIENETLLHKESKK